MRVTLDFWCPIIRSFGTDFQSSDCGHPVATSISGWLSCCEALDTEMKVTNTSALEWSVLQRVDEDPVNIQVALHSGSTSPVVLVSRPLASCLFLGAARAEFKALHGEGFHDASL